MLMLPRGNIAAPVSAGLLAGLALNRAAPEHYQPQAAVRPWLVHGYDRKGQSCWSGRFRSRADAELFVAVSNLGLLHVDPVLWRLPSPWWEPDGDAVVYQFEISVTHIDTKANSSGATRTMTVPAGGVPSGALICVGAVDRAPSGSGSVADDSSNTYTSIAQKSLNNTAASGFAQVFYAKNVTALASTNLITYTKGSSATHCSVSAFYATGVDTVAPLDGAVTASGAGISNSPSVTSGTPSQWGELMVGMVGTPGSASLFTQDTGNGWAAPFNEQSGAGTANSAYLMGGNQVNGGSGTKTYAPTFIGSALDWAAIVCGFQATPGNLYKPWAQMAPIMAQ